MSHVIKFRLVKFMSSLFYFLPFVLLTGPFLPDLFLSTIAVIFIYISIRDKEYKYYLNYFFFIFIFFYLIIIISSLVSEYKIFSLESSIFYFRYLIFALATWFLIENNKNFIKIFTYFLLFTFLYALIDGYYQYLYSNSIFGFDHEHPFRLNLPLDDKLFMGGYLSRIFPFLFGLVLITFKLNKGNYIFIGTLLILTDVLIFVSAERTALFLLTLSTIIILILLSELKLFRLVTIILSFLIIIIISFSSPEIKERNVDYTLEQMGATNESKKINIFSPQHESHFRGAFNMFKENVALGVGPNVFRKVCNYEGYRHNGLTCSTHPHNSYMQLLAETGVITFTIYISLFFLICFSMFNHLWNMLLRKKVKYSDYQICLLTAIVLTLWPFAPTLNFFSNWINIIYFMPVGFFLHTINKEISFQSK